MTKHEQKRGIWEAIHAAATIALWLRVEGADIGLVQVIRATRVLDGIIGEVQALLAASSSQADPEEEPHE